jgi:hypothetical protein
MPASYDEYFQAFTNLTGTSGEAVEFLGRDGGDHEIASVDHWIDMFDETGIDFDSHAQQIDAFENFLIAFYPTDNTSADEWYYARQEFYELYGIDEHNIDWDEYRRSIGY